MSDRQRSGAAVAVLAFSLGLLACATKGIEVREYVLTGEPGATGATAPRDLAIGVGPVKLPRYLRRIELATRTGTNEFRYADEHRWGETLDKGLARVVANHLAATVPATRVATFPWRAFAEPDYRVVIEVERFEAGTDGAVVLDARWSVFESASGQTTSQRSQIAQPSQGTDSPAKVAAMSQAAQQLSQDISAVIRARAGFASR